MLMVAGPLPPSLGLLIHLDTLLLDHNEFEGCSLIIQRTIARIIYHFFHQLLTGEIPKSIKNLSNLTVLRLENNKLSGNYLEGMYDFSSIITANIILSGCIPLQLCQLQFLKRLDLSNNMLSG